MHCRLFYAASFVLFVFATGLWADNAQDAYNLSVKANTLFKEKHYAEGLKLVEKAIQLDPKNPFYHGQAGDLNWRLGNYVAGLRESEVAIKLAAGKEDAWFLHMAGENAYCAQDFRLAKKYFQQAITRGEKALGGNFAIAKRRVTDLSDKTIELGAAADSTSVFPLFRGKSSVFLVINGLKRS